MNLAAGTRLGPYEIVGPLGAGGMGEVFRARDPRLGRDVAIKALPEAFAGDAERLARFEREARLLASLSHPHIAGIHGLEEVEGRRYLVLEFVEGETLAARLARGPLPVLEALQISAQIAAGVEAAHEAGIIHRDLKPGNVMLRPDGTVKVLDFGLAKSGVSMSSGSDPNLSASPTMTYAATSMGVVLGTAAYMSPEQARGKPVDRRTDIWSFGCVLYECLTGRQCFAGETLSDTIAMILQKDPDWNALPSRTPLRVRHLLTRCLERDAKKRLRDAGEARIALESSIAGLESGTELSIEAQAAGARAGGRGLPVGIAIGVVAGALLALLTGRMWGAGARGAAAPLAYFSIPMPEGRKFEIQTFLEAGEYDLSPDGRCVAVRLRTEPGAPGERLYWRRLSDASWTPLEGSDHAEGCPIFSHDGRSVYFLSEVAAGTNDRRVMRSSLANRGAAVTVCEVPPETEHLALLLDGRILLIHSTGRKFALVEPGSSGSPAWQDIDRGEFQGILDAPAMPHCPQLGANAVFVGTTLYTRESWHRGTAVLDVKTRKLTPVLSDGQWPVYHPSGYLVFSRGSAVLAQRFDLKSLKTRGEAVVLMDGVRSRGPWVPGRVRLSERGDLVSTPGGDQGSQGSILTQDMHGAWTEYTPERHAYSSISATPDGRRVAVTITNARGFDEIWTFDGDDRSAQRAISEPGYDIGRPCVSRDGRRIAHDRIGVDNDYRIVVDGFSGDLTPRPLCRFAHGDSTAWVMDWFPDNRHLLVLLRTGRNQLALLDADPPDVGPQAPRVILPEFDVANFASISPDGRWVAFDSERSGRSRIYVAGISPAGVTGPPVVVTRLGEFPGWMSRDAIVYGDSTRTRVVRLSSSGTPVSDELAGNLGDMTPRISAGIWLANGALLAVLRPPEGVNLSRLDMVQNWWASVKGRLPR